MTMDEMDCRMSMREFLSHNAYYTWLGEEEAKAQAAQAAARKVPNHRQFRG